MLLKEQIITLHKEKFQLQEEMGHYQEGA